MKKTVAALATAAMSVTLLTGCGGDDAYCAAVKDNKSVLNSFGQKRTNAGFATYAKAARTIAASAPDTVKDDWAKLGSVTDGVLKAHKRVGIKLDEMNDPAKVQGLDSGDLETLNKAYDRFNKTTPQRTAVVKDVKKACGITLK